jgi:hypothetical protein
MKSSNIGNAVHYEKVLYETKLKFLFLGALGMRFFCFYVKNMRKFRIKYVLLKIEPILELRPRAGSTYGLMGALAPP